MFSYLSLPLLDAVYAPRKWRSLVSRVQQRTVSRVQARFVGVAFIWYGREPAAALGGHNDRLLLCCAGADCDA